MDVESAMKEIMEILKGPLLVLQSLGGFLMSALDQAFPPEERARKLKQWVPNIVSGCLTVLVLWLVWKALGLFLCCCRHSWFAVCGSIKWVCNSIFKCCSGTRRAGVKMMRALGRRGDFIPRRVFESDPSSYFRVLHGE